MRSAFDAFHSRVRTDACRQHPSCLFCELVRRRAVDAWRDRLDFLSTGPSLKELAHSALGG